MTPGRPVVLHVLESYGAGSARAAETYAAATPWARHVVLRSVREGESIEGQEHRAFDEVLDLPRGARAAITTVRREVRRIRPTAVHAHSSFAGLYVRMALSTRQARRMVVYTPHCFAFERRDIPNVARLAFLLAEWVLGFRTSVIAACSPRERALASRMPTRRPPIEVPNVSDLPLSTDVAGTVDGPVVSIGRLSPQKDPELFRDIARSAREAGVRSSFLWIGTGPAGQVDAMDTAGVEVSGWIDRDRIQDLMSGASSYIHTAAWEGFPIAVLESVAAGIPVIARDIPAMADAPQAWLFEGPEQGAALLGRLRTAEARAANVAAWRASLVGHTPEVQADRLRQVYCPS